MEHFIKIDGKEVPLIFGLKSLIYLSNSIKYNRSISIKKILLLSTRDDSQVANITPIYKLIKSDNALPESVKKQVRSLVSSIDIPSSEEIDELYRKSVGEMGLSPTDFFNMTVDEINLAYEGYLQRKELEANLVLLAINKGLSRDFSSIKIAPTIDYTVGSEKERKATFENWSIQEEN